METGVIVIVALIVLFILFRIFKAFLKWGIIILLIGLVAAYFTNPGETVHRESFKIKAKELSLKRARQKDLKIDDYKLFSLSKINADGEQKLVGIGAFGKVWYFADLKEKIGKK